MRPIAYSSDGKETEEMREWSYAYMNKKLKIDITEKLTSFMRNNGRSLAEYRLTHNYVDTAFYFYNNVTDGGTLDIKLQDDWQFKDGFIYTFNGHHLRSDDPGNINFGYVGAIIFPEGILCAGAGLNQIKNHGFIFGNLASCYDDPRDNLMIRYGYYLFGEDMLCSN